MRNFATTTRTTTAAAQTSTKQINCRLSVSYAHGTSFAFCALLWCRFFYLQKQFTSPNTSTHTLIFFLSVLFSPCFFCRVLELSFIFLLVWYYCTLTIRESILKVNGSRIKGWWRAHHFISTVCAGVLLIWPQGEPWQLFRNQFMYFNAYISMVQFLQFRYQRGVLYRLKALGERHDMDITIEGFHSWMWRGLTFLLPFLFVGYVFQAYNSYALWKLSSHPDAPWQVLCLSILFCVLFVGNTLTTLWIIPEKIMSRVSEHYRLLALSKQKKVREFQNVFEILCNVIRFHWMFHSYSFMHVSCQKIKHFIHWWEPSHSIDTRNCMNERIIIENVPIRFFLSHHYRRAKQCLDTPTWSTNNTIVSSKGDGNTKHQFIYLVLYFFFFFS